MKTNFILILVAMFVTTFSLQAQDETLDELKAMMAEKQGVVDGIGAEIAALDARIKAFPGWSKGLGGTLGFNLSGTRDWFANDVAKVSSRGIGISIAGFANYNEANAKYFWNNTLNVSITSANSKSDNNDDGDFDTADGSNENLTSAASLFVINSLGGYQLFSTVYASAAANYATTVANFNDPGQFTLSAGLTWKPTTNLVAYIHPLAFQKTFPGGDFSSATGAVWGATYSGEIYPGISWTSAIDGFYAYGGDDEAVPALTRGQLSNWTWQNGFSVANIFKGVGLGFNLGIRKNEQLGIVKGVEDPSTIQLIYNLGLSYAL